MEIFQRAYREIRPRAPIPEFQVRFYPFANINNTIRLREEKVYVRLSDMLEGAPPEVLHAIAHILLAKLYRKPVDSRLSARYRKHIGSRAVAEKAHLLRQMRGRKKIHGPVGNIYDLNEIFDELNTAYFHGLLARPEMTWSATDSRHSLGHYDPAHNAIVVSRVFDHPRIPRFAVEYLVYHEMLHLKHPVRLRGSRRCIHSEQFQEEEKRFTHFEEAKRFLKGL